MKLTTSAPARGGRPRRYAGRAVAKSITLDPDIYDALVRRSPGNISRAVNDLLIEALALEQKRQDVAELAQLAGVEIDPKVSARAALEFEKLFERVEQRRAERAGDSTVA